MDRQRTDGTFVLLATAVFLQADNIGALFPLLARIQAADHLPTWGLGLMAGTSFFSALIVQVTATRLLDGRWARPALMVGLALAVAGPLWFSLSHHLWSLTLARAASGAGFALMMPAALRAAAVGPGDVEITADRRGRRIGLLSSAQMSGIVVGPLVGVGLYSWSSSLHTPFMVLAATSAVILVLALVKPSVGRVVPASSSTVGGGEETGSSGPPSILSPAVVAVLLLAIAAQMPMGLYDALWSRLLTDRGSGTFLIGLSLALFGVPFVALAPLGGRLAAGRSPLRWTAAAAAVASAFLFSYGVVPSPTAIVVLGLFEAAAQAVVVPGGYATAALVYGERWAATGQGLYSGAGTAAAGLASVLGAWLYGLDGPGVVFGGAATICVLCALAAVRAWNRSGVDAGAGADSSPGSGPESGSGEPGDFSQMISGGPLPSAPVVPTPTSAGPAKPGG